MINQDDLHEQFTNSQVFILLKLGKSFSKFCRGVGGGWFLKIWGEKNFYFKRHISKPKNENDFLKGGITFQKNINP